MFSFFRNNVNRVRHFSVKNLAFTSALAASVVANALSVAVLADKANAQSTANTATISSISFSCDDFYYSGQYEFFVRIGTYWQGWTDYDLGSCYEGGRVSARINNTWDQTFYVYLFEDDPGTINDQLGYAVINTSHTGGHGFTVDDGYHKGHLNINISNVQRPSLF